MYAGTLIAQIWQSPKYQEKLRNARLCNNDKNTFHLPRQCLRGRAKALILLGFLEEEAEFTPLEDRIGIVRIGKA